METQPNSFFNFTDFADNAVELVKVRPPLFFKGSPCVLTVGLKQANPSYNEKRCKAFVCDITATGEGSLLSHVAPESVDVVLMIFVMSAIPPSKMPQVLANISAVRTTIPIMSLLTTTILSLQILKPGGYVLFRFSLADLSPTPLTMHICRDYGKYDLTQIRFLSKKDSKKLEDSLYLRNDGTLSYYFSQG